MVFNSNKLNLALVLFLLSILIAFLVLSLAKSNEYQEKQSKVEILGTGVNGTGFVDNNLCQSCHTDEYKAWKTSHHYHAMEEPSELSVLGDFDNSVYSDANIHAKFSKRDNLYFVALEDATGSTREFEVKYTFGWHPLQQYLLALPGGRLQALTVAWDVNEKKWFRLLSNENAHYGDAAHWAGRLHNWNSQCAECHSTNLEKNYDSITDTYQTHFSGINVNCQACHGPGEKHITWANSEDIQKEDNGIVVNIPSKMNRVERQQAEINMCARCHSRRTRLTENDHHGESFLEQFTPLLLSEEHYYSDGQIDDEVYVYGSFVQSKMYKAGVTCSDCHNVHTGETHAKGDAICTSCHNLSPSAEFASLKPFDYTSSKHHHHPIESEGARCVSCHMPDKTFMGIDPRRDHSFKIPKPDLSEQIGSPNACVNCHQDKDNNWASTKLRSWHNKGASSQKSFAKAIHLGRLSEQQGLIALAELVESQEPFIARATAADLLGQYGNLANQSLQEFSQDEHLLVRAAALEGLSRIPSPENKKRLVNALNDSSRLVRITAARGLVGIPRQDLSEKEVEAYNLNIAEYIKTQQASAETPEAQLNLARFYSQNGDVTLATKAFEKAIQLDSKFGPSYFQYATILSQLGKLDAAESVLQQAIDHIPSYSDSYFALGLLYAQKGSAKQAAPMLKKSMLLQPDNPQYSYNYGLLLQQMGLYSDAEKALRQSYAASVSSPEALYALAVMFIESKDSKQAEETLRQLMETFPNYQPANQLFKHLQKND